MKEECYEEVNVARENEINMTKINAYVNQDGSFEIYVKAKNKEEFRALCSFMNELFEKY